MDLHINDMYTSKLHSSPIQCMRWINMPVNVESRGTGGSGGSEGVGIIVQASTQDTKEPIITEVTKMERYVFIIVVKRFNEDKTFRVVAKDIEDGIKRLRVIYRKVYSGTAEITSIARGEKVYI